MPPTNPAGQQSTDSIKVDGQLMYAHGRAAGPEKRTAPLLLAGVTPLECAVAQGFKEIAKILIQVWRRGGGEGEGSAPACRLRPALCPSAGDALTHAAPPLVTLAGAPSPSPACRRAARSRAGFLQLRTPLT
jgi:hypothetical protein